MRHTVWRSMKKRVFLRALEQYSRMSVGVEVISFRFSLSLKSEGSNIEWAKARVPYYPIDRNSFNFTIIFHSKSGPECGLLVQRRLGEIFTNLGRIRTEASTRSKQNEDHTFHSYPKCDFSRYKSPIRKKISPATTAICAEYNQRVKPSETRKSRAQGSF